MLAHTDNHVSMGKEARAHTHTLTHTHTHTNTLTLMLNHSVFKGRSPRREAESITSLTGIVYEMLIAVLRQRLNKSESKLLIKTDRVYAIFLPMLCIKLHVKVPTSAYHYLYLISSSNTTLTCW